MADVQYRLGWHIYDQNGVYGVASIFGTVADSTSLASLASAAAPVSAAVNGVSAGYINSVTLALELAKPANSGKPESDSRTYEVGEFQCSNVTSPRRWSFVVPSMKQSLVSGSSIPYTGGAVKTLTDLLVGGSSPLVFANNHYEVLSAITSAFPGLRQRRRGNY